MKIQGLACCDDSTFYIDKNNSLQASGDNRFKQIDDTKKEYNKFIPTTKEKVQYINAKGASIAVIDVNNTLKVRGRIQKTIQNVQKASVGDKLAYISDGTLYISGDTEYNTEVQADEVDCSDSIYYTKDGNLFKYPDKDMKVKVKFFTKKFGNLAYIDENDELYINTIKQNIKAKKIALGFKFMVLIDLDGYLWVKGLNSYSIFGELPKVINEFTLIDQKAKDIAAGTYHFVYVDENNKVQGRGYNFSGQLGCPSKTSNTAEIEYCSDVDIKPSETPKTEKAPKVKKIPKVKKVEKSEDEKNKFDAITAFKELDKIIDKANKMIINLSNAKIDPIIQKSVVRYGKDFSVIIQDGNVFGKGLNSYGIFGTQKELKEYTTLNIKAKKIACGFGHIILLDENNKVQVSGMNYYGQLGLGHNDHIEGFTEVCTSNIKDEIQDIQAGNWSSSIITKKGLVYEAGLMNSKNKNKFILVFNPKD